MKRIYHPYTTWEEVKSGMWDKVSKEKEDQFLPIAIEFTGDHLRYGMAMNRVINEWPISCENSLTDTGINRKAWLGHAACSLQLGIPEYIVRTAWNQLTEMQRELANSQADHYINQWIQKHQIGSQLILNYER